MEFMSSKVVSTSHFKKIMDKVDKRLRPYLCSLMINEFSLVTFMILLNILFYSLHTNFGSVMLVQVFPDIANF